MPIHHKIVHCRFNPTPRGLRSLPFDDELHGGVDKTDIGICIQYADFPLQVSRQHHVILEKNANILAASQLNRPVPIPGNATLSYILMNVEPWIGKRARNSERIIRRAIVNNEQFKITKALVQYTLNRFGKKSTPVISWDTNTNFY